MEVSLAFKYDKASMTQKNLTKASFCYLSNYRAFENENCTLWLPECRRGAGRVQKTGLNIKNLFFVAEYFKTVFKLKKVYLLK